MAMAQLLAIFLLLALIPQSPCQVVITASSTSGPKYVPPPNALHSSFVQPASSSQMDTPEGETGSGHGENARDFVQGPDVLLARDVAEGKLVHTEEDKRKDLDDWSTLPQRHTQEQEDATVKTYLDSSYPNSQLKTSGWNVELTTAASMMSSPETSATAGKRLTTVAETPEYRQGTTAQRSKSTTTHSPQQVHSQNSAGKVTEGPNKEGTENGSNHLFLAAVGIAESSTVSVSSHHDRLTDFQPQAQTTGGFSTTKKALSSPTVSQSNPSSRLPANPGSHIGSPDFKTTVLMVTASTTRNLGKGVTLIQTTYTPKSTIGRATTVTGLTTHLSPTSPLQKGRGFGPKDERAIDKNVSIALGHPPYVSRNSTLGLSPEELCGSGRGPCHVSTGSNSTALLWGDLQRTLAFAWELHVYGTAGLFLVLAGGALVGLLLSPSMHCSHRSFLALANVLLLLASIVRAISFFLDPYGTRGILPRAGVTVLYNLPMPLLLWTQTSIVLLALQVTNLMLLPPSLQRAPLAGVLTVLHCTLLLAVDVLSPALSPAVPVVLQMLSVSCGLVLCLGFFFYIFPHLQNPPTPPLEEPVSQEEGRQMGRQTGRVLGRVLAVCASLGVLCCALHVHATLWLYGLLGDWRQFSWTWWLVQFWARLLELAWASFLLLLASWVFWRPQSQSQEGPGEGGAGADLLSSASSSASTQSHTCWSKIVHSLRGHPCKKSDNSVLGEVPNNWAGQDRPGADISKSLIRNRDQLPNLRSVKDSNCGRNQKGGATSGSTGSLLRLHSLGRPPQRSVSSSLDCEKEWAREKQSVLSLNEFDLRPPSPIDLSRSIDDALHREHLLRGGMFFRTLCPPSPTSPGSHRQPLSSWPRRSSDPQINISESSSCGLSEDHKGRTQSAAPPGGDVPGKLATAPPTPTDQSFSIGSISSSVSCPVSLRPYRDPVGDDSKPFLNTDMEGGGAAPGRVTGAGRSFLEVSRQEDSTSVSSEIIDL